MTVSYITFTSILIAKTNFYGYTQLQAREPGKYSLPRSLPTKKKRETFLSPKKSQNMKINIHSHMWNNPCHYFFFISIFLSLLKLFIDILQMRYSYSQAINKGSREMHTVGKGHTFIHICFNSLVSGTILFSKTIAFPHYFGEFLVSCPCLVSVIFLNNFIPLIISCQEQEH